MLSVSASSKARSTPLCRGRCHGTKAAWQIDMAFLVPAWGSGARTKRTEQGGNVQAVGGQHQREYRFCRSAGPLRVV